MFSTSFLLLLVTEPKNEFKFILNPHATFPEDTLARCTRTTCTVVVVYLHC